MASRPSTSKPSRSAGLPIMRAGTVAVAAMATGLFVGTAPANADFEDLLDPVLQPLLTHVVDSLSGMDGALAVDVTTWADHALAHLSSLDAVSASSTGALTPDATPVGGIVPITINEYTEPSVQASFDLGAGGNNDLLVDTGSSGLVVPWQEFGTSHLEVLRELRAAGDHLEKVGHSGYSGGVQYTYREYDGITVDYGNGAVTTDNTPVDIVWNSHGSFGSSVHNFQQFLQDNDVQGILGIGDNTAGPTTSPLEAVGFQGVTVDLPDKELIIGDATNPGTAIATVSGAPISTLYETVTTAGKTLGSQVSDDVDSGGVYGTIPASLGAAPGSLITVYSSQGGTELYSYLVGTDGGGYSELPTAISGTSIDSGVMPFFQEPIFLDYANNTMSFDHPLS
jgi:hypothetical protein